MDHPGEYGLWEKWTGNEEKNRGDPEVSSVSK